MKSNPHVERSIRSYHDSGDFLLIEALVAKHFGDTPDGEILIGDSLDQELAALLASNDGSRFNSDDAVKEVSKALLETLDEVPPGRHSVARFEIIAAEKRAKPRNWEDKPVQRSVNREPVVETPKPAGRRFKKESFAHLDAESKARLEVESAAETAKRPAHLAPEVAKPAPEVAKPTAKPVARPDIAKPVVRPAYKPAFSRQRPRFASSPRRPGEFTLDQALAGLTPVVKPPVQAPKFDQPPAITRPQAPRPVIKPAGKPKVEPEPQILLPATDFDLEFWLNGQRSVEPKVSHNLFEAIAYNRLARTSVGLLVAVALTYMTSVSEMREAQVPTDQLAAASRATEQSASRSSQSVATPVLVVDTAPTTTAAPPPTTAPAPPQPTFGQPLDSARISSEFGNRTNPVTGRYTLHAGIDFAAASGTPIKAVADGKVVQAGWESGYGNYTCIQHADGLKSCYAHQSSIGVKVGQQVKRGDVIGKVGSTGNSTGAHLHLEARLNGTPVNPRKYL